MEQCKRGKYIVIDGIDGGGKTTLFEALKELFPPLKGVTKEDGAVDTGDISGFVYTREPGGTTLGENIRTLLLNQPMDPFSEMCLFMAQRKEVRNSLEPFLCKGIHVISDRSESATFSYQIRGRGLDYLESMFWEMNRNLAPFPTMYIFLDLSPSIAFERLHGRGDNVTLDVFEKEQIGYFEKVRNAFIEFPSKVSVPCFFVEAHQQKEKVASSVIKHIQNHLDL